MRFAFSESVETPFNKQLPVGRYKSLIVNIQGTNESGQTVTVTDFKWILTYNGIQFMNVNGRLLKQINEETQGIIKNSSTAGAAYEIQFEIPFSFYGLPNAIDVRPGDIFTIEVVEASGLAAKNASGTYRVFTEDTNAPHSYLPKVKPANQSVAGATEGRVAIPDFNVSTLWVYAAADVTSIRVERDGNTIVAADYDELVTRTALKYRFEDAASSTFARIDMGDGIDGLISGQVLLNYTTSDAETFEVYYLVFDYLPEKATESRAVLQQEIAARVDRVSSQTPNAVPGARRIANQTPVLTEQKVKTGVS